MDIVTHGLLGVAVAAPLAGAQPEAALAFMVGSALPDIDALSRLFGRRAFLACHQTFTHSGPGILAASAAAGLAAHGLGLPGWAVAAGLGLGMAGHSLLDFTNTYGVALWSPFSSARSCGEWLFFIDAPVILLTLCFLVPAGLGMIPQGWAAACPALLALYVLGRARLKARALRLAPPDTVSLLPTALLPWRYLGAAREGESVRLFSLDARTGRTCAEEVVPWLDSHWAAALESLPQYQAMRRISPLYHVVSASPGQPTILVCQDLRTRQFGARFGELTVAIGPDGKAAVKGWRL
jgi:membrane-bound metal-dependent hydrolase YbcI (DUF457 family)